MAVDAFFECLHPDSICIEIYHRQSSFGIFRRVNFDAGDRVLEFLQRVMGIPLGDRGCESLDSDIRTLYPLTDNIQVNPTAKPSRQILASDTVADTLLPRMYP